MCVCVRALLPIKLDFSTEQLVWSSFSHPQLFTDPQMHAVFKCGWKTGPSGLSSDWCASSLDAHFKVGKKKNKEKFFQPRQKAHRNTRYLGLCFPVSKKVNAIWECVLSQVCLSVRKKETAKGGRRRRHRFWKESCNDPRSYVWAQINMFSGHCLPIYQRSFTF